MTPGEFTAGAILLVAAYCVAARIRKDAQQREREASNAAAEQGLRRVIQIAAEVAQFQGTPNDVVTWFFTKQAFIDYRRPVDLIAEDADWAELNAALARTRPPARIPDPR